MAGVREFMEAQNLELPLTLVCNDLHLQMEGYPVERGVEIEITILASTAGGLAMDFR
jgi:hypothetical protein